VGRKTKNITKNTHSEVPTSYRYLQRHPTAVYGNHYHHIPYTMTVAYLSEEREKKHYDRNNIIMRRSVARYFGVGTAARSDRISWYSLARRPGSRLCRRARLEWWLVRGASRARSVTVARARRRRNSELAAPRSAGLAPNA